MEPDNGKGTERYGDDAGRVRSRLDDIKRRGGRSEYAFEPGGDLSGRPPIFYDPGHLITTAESAHVVHRLLEEWFGACGEPVRPIVGDDNVVAFEVAGDSLHLARAIKEAAAALPDAPENLEIGPLHVMTPAPQPMIGPGDDPTPASGADLARRGPEVEGRAHVAVVDTGIWTDPASGLLTKPADAVTDVEAVDDDPHDGFVDFYGTGHGGFIAGIIESNAPGIKVAAYNAFGKMGLTELSVIDKVDAALSQSDVVVINLSLGSYEIDEAGCHRIELVALRSAMRRWKHSTNALIVAAAGNDGRTYPFYPAGFAADSEFADMVVSVGALAAPAGTGAGIHSAAASFSNHGSWVTAWAPGSRVVSAYPKGLKFEYHDAFGGVTPSPEFNDGLARWSGTSFAAPFVAAEIVRAMKEGESPRDTWARIRGTSPFVVFWPSW